MPGWQLDLTGLLVYWPNAERVSLFAICLLVPLHPRTPQIPYMMQVCCCIYNRQESEERERGGLRRRSLSLLACNGRTRAASRHLIEPQRI